MLYADVILPVPLEGMFTYAVPPAMQQTAAPGMRVLVPFGTNKKHVGIVDSIHDRQPQGYKVKEIEQCLDSEPMVMPGQLKLWHWIESYYMSPIGEILKAALPAGLKEEDGYRPKTETYIRLCPQYRSEQALHIAIDMLRRAATQQKVFLAYLNMSGWDMLGDEGLREITREELMNTTACSLQTIHLLKQRGLLEEYEVEVGRLNHGGEPHPENMKRLTTAQQEAYNNVLFSFMKHDTTLLHGVTSSGKTEIFIHLIQHEIDQNRQVLYLLPEIALTVQMMDRLRRVFGNRLGIYHSKYSDAERVEIWKKQLSKAPYDVILGARSALMLPFQRLGLIIVDEEHETSFKQQDPAPRYHARSTAIMMAKIINSCKPKTLLATATPCAETWHNATTGKYGLVTLSERYQGIELPEVEIVDIGELKRKKMMRGIFSPLLILRAREALERGEQVILFQNRRGWAPMIECKQCGWVPRCEHCDVSLTLHRNTSQLVCHYCGFTYRVPDRCPACEGKEMFSKGFGTEKIEDEIRQLLPMARVARMDLDTTRTRNAYERLISDFASGTTNLLIGTQMISKGLDFDRVSVVGILDADSMLHQPDFRAYEHAYTMISQVSGRAGRKGKRGLVILQTRQPQLPVITQVAKGQWAAFSNELMAERRAFHYPPFTRLIYVFLRHRHDQTVETAAIEMGSRLRQWFGQRVLGPDKPPVARVKALSIRKIVLKLEPGIDLNKAKQLLREAATTLMSDKRYGSLQVFFDVDPL